MKASRRVREESHEVLCCGGVDAVLYWGKRAAERKSMFKGWSGFPEYLPDGGFQNLQRCLRVPG
jgi:hypothetical protein